MNSFDTLNTLDKNRVEDMMISKTPLEIATLLIYYKRLDNKGYVYHEEKLEGTYTMYELLSDATNYDKKTLDEFMDYGFTKDENTQSRTIEKYNINRKFLDMCHLVSKQYTVDNKGIYCHRIKKTIKTKDILDSKSGMKNCYPYEYIKQVKNFLIDNPITEWHINRIDENYIQYKTENKYECQLCSIIVYKSNRKKHYIKCVEDFKNIIYPE